MGKRVSFDGTSITLKAGETTTLNDTNGVLADYTNLDVTHEGIHITHQKGDNSMSLTVNDGCNIENLTITDLMSINWGLIKEGTQNEGTTVYIGFEDGVQDQLYSLRI
mgnify:FL=1